jgi:hypothetical protein
MFVPYSISDFIEPNVLFYRCRADKKAQNMTQLLHPAAQHGFSAAAELYQQVSQTDLLKLGIQVNLPQENSCQLMDSFGHGLVFNMISQKIESYAPDAIALNHKFLLPIFAKGNGLVHIYYNDMRYTVVMNDRQIMKLVHEQAELSTGMHPLLMKKYSDYYLISYKQFNFSCDEYGGFDLVEDIPETAQFLVSSDAESDVFL